MENIYAVIMAGGVGTRFWPKSRKAIPKQYLNLTGRQSMIQMSVSRIQEILPDENIYVVSTRDQESILTSQLDWLPKSNIIFEPFGKNTAPCIGITAIHLIKKNPDAIMIVMPADHLISETQQFILTLKAGVELVQKSQDALITLGIKPTFPATGYGYIQKGASIQADPITAYEVRAFAEKPTLDVAEKFYHSGEFYWNSGIFIWRADTILAYLESLMPDLYQGLCQIAAAIGKSDLESVTEMVYKQIYSESIDYGVMEHASKVLVIEGDFGWDDVGSWEAVYDISKKDENGNVVKGNAILKDVKNSYIESTERLVSILGVDDLIVIDTPDALLVCKRKKSQDVKWVVEKLKLDEQTNYL
jgi:mannose-1-phosphate guanylyltransferase